jgi:hypothetical protein
VVHSENPDDIVIAYFVVNALVLGLGIGLNWLGAWLRSRGAGRALAARAAGESPSRPR